MTKNKIAKTSKIYLNKFARYFGLQYKPSSGAERKKSVKFKRIVTNKGLKFKVSEISLTISDFQSSSTKVVLVKVDHIYVISTRYSANFHSTEKALAGSRVETIMPVIINLCFFHLHLFVDYCYFVPNIQDGVGLVTKVAI